MNSNVAVLRSAATVSNLPAAVVTRRAHIVQHLSTLSTSREAERCRALIQSLEAINDPNSQERHDCERKIRDRFKRLESIGNIVFTTDTCRYLEIVVFFGLGKIRPDLRLEACAHLKLRGREESLQAVCTAFPGFRQAIGG